MDAAFASARDRLGQTLCGKYQLETVLGVGGTAVVYRASHRNGHKVAVKMLHDYLCKSRDVSRRFMREGYLANVLDHPGTVRVLDDDTSEDGIAFLVLEMLEGETLEDRRVRLGGTLPLDEVLGLTDQLLSVLQAAHEKNVIHRDIKPANLFLTHEGVLKVLDFGIARIVNEGAATATKTGTTIGTPAFMPPEQALSKPREVDAQSDIWAVGATMFTLLSGELVHIAESSSEHLVKAATVPARSVAKVVPGVPENVEALVARALFFNKTQRWASAAEMRHELWRVRLEPGRPIGTASTPPPHRAPASNFPTVVGKRDSGGTAKLAMSLQADARSTSSSRRAVMVSTAVGAALLVSAASIAIYGSIVKSPGFGGTASAATSPVRTVDEGTSGSGRVAGELPGPQGAAGAGAGAGSGGAAITTTTSAGTGAKTTNDVGTNGAGTNGTAANGTAANAGTATPVSVPGTAGTVGSIAGSAGSTAKRNPTGGATSKPATANAGAARSGKTPAGAASADLYKPF